MQARNILTNLNRHTTMRWRKLGVYHKHFHTYCIESTNPSGNLPGLLRGKICWCVGPVFAPLTIINHNWLRTSCFSRLWLENDMLYLLFYIISIHQCYYLISKGLKADLRIHITQLWHSEFHKYTSNLTLIVGYRAILTSKANLIIS